MLVIVQILERKDFMITADLAVSMETISICLQIFS